MVSNSLVTPSGRRARPQVWHINSAFHTWPGSFGAGPRSLECNLTIFSLSRTSWHGRRSGRSWQDPERKKTDSTPGHQILGILWLTLKRNPPQNTRKGPWDPPQLGHFSPFHYVKSPKNVGNSAVGTHHSYEVGTGFNMFLYHQSLLPESFTLTPQLFKFSRNCPLKHARFFTMERSQERAQARAQARAQERAKERAQEGNHKRAQ